MRNLNVMKSFTPVIGFRACSVPSQDGLRITLPRRLSGLSLFGHFDFEYLDLVRCLDGAILLVYNQRTCPCHFCPKVPIKSSIYAEMEASPQSVPDNKKWL